MTARPYNVLFLCTGNSARSILAESLVNHWGAQKFRGFSAGSFPKGAVHPIALDLLAQLKLPIEGLRSKSWNEFAAPGAPALDFVFTVCDNAAGEICPIWPGQPMTAHWGVPDPAAVEGTQAQSRRWGCSASCSAIVVSRTSHGWLRRGSVPPTGLHRPRRSRIPPSRSPDPCPTRLPAYVLPTFRHSSLRNSSAEGLRSR